MNLHPASPHPKHRPIKIYSEKSPLKGIIQPYLTLWNKFCKTISEMKNAQAANLSILEIQETGGDAANATNTVTPSNDREASGLKGQKRSNSTHDSTTDADARLYRKGKTASELRFMGHTLTDNPHGLVVSAMVTQADGYAEREAAKAMTHDTKQAPEDPLASLTLGADKGYDAQEFIQALQDMNVLPHVAQNTSWRKSAVPEAVAASVGYKISQTKRKRIEQGFGWAKTMSHMGQVLVRGLDKVDQMFVLTMSAYNLTRLRTLGQVRPAVRIPVMMNGQSSSMNTLSRYSQSPAAIV